MRVTLPEALGSPGIVDIGSEQVPVETDDDGTRYIDVDEDDARRLRGIYADNYDDYEVPDDDDDAVGEEAWEPEDMTRSELRGMYENLGGKEADPEGDEVSLNVNDDIIAGINRLMGED